jgi:2-dehydro-3-deoxygalactonokinase
VSSEAQWVAVDWGTSNLRAWGIGAGGEVVFARTSDPGMGKLARDAYASAFRQLLAADFAPAGPPVEALICGMAGARQGWMEAPYLDVPADLGALRAGAVAPAMTPGRLSVHILPGVCQRTAGAEDVMRGEETQLLGLATLRPGFSGVVCMPGTHCKWVQLSGERLERFSTAMTGELFEVLRTHSVLRHSFGGSLEGPDRGRGLDEGLVVGIEAPQKLPALLFKVRSASLLSGRTPDWCAGFLSGLLIGSEIGANRDWIDGSGVAIVGDAKLAQLYVKGLAMMGAATQIIDGGEATLAGLKAARRQS